MKNILGCLMLGILVGSTGCESREPTKLDARGLEAEPTRRPVAFEADVAPWLDRYCRDCHGSSLKRGGITLEGTINRETWGRVADVLRSGSMPPKGRARPDGSETAMIQEWIEAEVFSCSDGDPGRATLRRLNRSEYDHTIQDLFGFDREANFSASFPADDVGEGFDRIGDVLAIPPVLMEKYLAAADLAIQAAARSPRVWSKVMSPPLDIIPPSLRKPTFAVRSEPIKRIGRPLLAAPVVEDPQAVELGRAREILRAFADRAFRRPATQAELTRLVALVESARKEGDDFDQAIQFALKAVLISPHFLLLVEQGASDDFAVASRLSYFLTSRPPDDVLYRLAALGLLRQGGNLEKQVWRSLCDEKSRALVDGFILQWLQVRALNEATPDPRRFPDFDEPLRQAMLEETRRFAGEIIHDDRSLVDFIDADFTYINERLARHYGIEGVSGPEFRRISLTGSSHRGGVLSQASVLTVTSNPTRTSPVKRGKWVLDVLLGMPPPPPPDGVEGLKMTEGGAASGTMRQRMERHRLDPGCASCHDRMDPIGFGLENFDAIGRWRSLEDGQGIDASGSLPAGDRFSGPSELRSALKVRSESFIRCMAEKMLIYAIGRGLKPEDRCYVEEIVRKTRRGGDRFSSLVLAIVESPPFQNRPGVKSRP